MGKAVLFLINAASGGVMLFAAAGCLLRHAVPLLFVCAFGCLVLLVTFGMAEGSGGEWADGSQKSALLRTAVFALSAAGFSAAAAGGISVILLGVCFVAVVAANYAVYLIAGR